MRTTLDIEDDVLMAAKEQAGREGKTLGEVISALVRQALNAPLIDAARVSKGVKEPKAIYGFRPFPARGPVATNELVNKLREEDAY